MFSTTSFDTLWNILITGQNDCKDDRRDEFLFLYPFRLEKPGEIGPLSGMVYGGNELSFSPPNADLLKSALRSGNWKAADQEARKIVDQVLDMPGRAAQQYQAELVQALEFLEIQPLFQKIDPELIRAALSGDSSAKNNTDLPAEIQDVIEMRNLNRRNVDEVIKSKPNHPRMGTLRFVALRNEFARMVPDGWLFQIQEAVSKETWRELEQSVDLWLKDYRQHPLADLVLLWKARIYYFKGDLDGAWEQLLSVYPRRLPRVLYDMRYLVIHEAYEPPYEPPAKGPQRLRTIEDPLLFTALLPSLDTDIDSDQWERWWRVSEANRTRPWAVNLQERLLAKLPRSGGLPASFPKEPRNPTQLWGKLRALALMNAEKWEDARKQLFSLEPDEEQALLAVAFHLRRGQPLLAAQVIDVPEHIRLYLVRVIFDDEELRELQTKKDAILKKEVLAEQGARLAEKGEWAEAAEIIGTIDPERSKLWLHVARLKKDASPTTRLQLARFLKDNRGKLFYDDDLLWETARSRNAHDGWFPEMTGLPWTPDREQTGITRYFLGTTELWLALQAYVDWLSTAEPSPQMSKVVKEADYCYNRLIGPGYWNWYFWSKYLPDHPVANELRKAGKRAKQEK